MDGGQPPLDLELRKVIDKFAQFVARNGVEFENMTKEKQRNNPKFAFLFGGECFNYYQHRLSFERSMLMHNEAAHQGDKLIQSHQVLPPPDSPWQQNMPFTNPPPSVPNVDTAFARPPFQLPLVNVQKNFPPISAPFQPCEQFPSFNQFGGNPPTSIPPPPIVVPNTQTDLIAKEMQSLTDQITQSEQNLAAQYQVLMQQQNQQIEEAIRLAQTEELFKLSHETNISLDEYDRVLESIIVACTKDGISTGKQWIFSKALSERHSLLLASHLLRRVVTPGADFNLKLHLIYLLNDVLHHCVRKNVNDLHQCLETVVVPMFCNSMLAANPEQAAKLLKLLTLWESKSNYFSEAVIHMLKDAPASWQNYQTRLSSQYADQVATVTRAIQSQYDGYRSQHEAFVQHSLQCIQELQQKINQRPLVDLSRPPPGFQSGSAPSSEVPQKSDESELLPAVPYYDLPAGVMVPMVKLEDYNYHPLDPENIRLPPPDPPSERLLAAVEAFYAAPSHERPRGRNMRLEDAPNRRDRDGWEQLGLYEFLKAKNSYRRQKERDIEDGIREASPPPSPISSPSSSRSPTPVKQRRYSSISPQRSETDRLSRRRSKSRSRSKSPYRRSSPRRSLSPKDSHRYRSPSPRESSRRRSQSPRSSSRRRSPSPRELSRRRTPSPPSRESSRRRSVSPPAYAGFGSTAPLSASINRLDESNKGHQLLKAMGWGGAGLGSKEQGIAEPISGGDVRDRQDKFKGVGVDLHDPFENFRKNKGQAFVTRMRARAEEVTAPLAALKAKEEGKRSAQ